MDSGSGFVEVQTTPLLTSPAIITASGVASGASLTFRYRAQNVHGSSETYSPEVIIFAATIPDAPTSAQTIAVEFDSKLTVTWVAPLNTGGNAIPITAYEVLVQKYDGGWSQAPTTYCDTAS